MANSSFANWKELGCRPDPDDPNQNVYVHDNSGARMQYKKEDGKVFCEFSIHSKGNGGFPQIIVNKEGHVKYRTRSGIKTFMMIPKQQNPKLYIDNETGNYKIINSNNSEIFIDGRTGRVSKELTKDFKVHETHELKLDSPKYPMITFPLKNGSDTSTDPNQMPYLEHENRICQFPAREMFHYLVRCPNGKLCAKGINEARRIAGEQYENEYLPGSIPYIEKLKKEGKKYPKLMTKEGFIRQQLDRAVFKSLDGAEVLEELSDFQGCGLVINKENINSGPTTPALPKPGTVSSNEEIQANEVPVVVSPTKVPPQINTGRDTTILNENNSSEGSVENNIRQNASINSNTDPNNPDLDIDVNQVAEELDSDQKIEFCLAKINEYFDQPHGKKELEEYVRLQSNIALNRIAWVSMKINQESTGNIEENILDLLKKRNPNLHQSFLNKTLKTRNQRLLAAMADLKQESKKHIKYNNSPYEIRYADMKIVDILVELEKDPKYGRSSATGAKDLTSIIRNSMKNRLDRKAANIEKFQNSILELTTKKYAIETKIVQFLAENGCSQESDFLACGDKNRRINFDNLINEQKNILDQFYAKMFEKNQEIKNNFLWRSKDKNYWLKVK